MPTKTTMSASTIEQVLLETLWDRDGDRFNEELATATGDDDTPILEGLETFSEAGLLTRDNGLVVKMSDGTEYQITIKRSR